MPSCQGFAARSFDTGDNPAFCAREFVRAAIRARAYLIDSLPGLRGGLRDLLRHLLGLLPDAIKGALCALARHLLDDALDF